MAPPVMAEDLKMIRDSEHRAKPSGTLNYFKCESVALTNSRQKPKTKLWRILS